MNDDRVGRALDQLFISDRASLLTALSLRAIDAFGIALEEPHDDSTSLVLYPHATGEAVAGISPPRPARGFNKDHRPDLKQLVWILTISTDGAVPITYRMVHGNVEDSTTHITTSERCCAIARRSDCLYVTACKLATRDNMEHIASHSGRLLTILPGSLIRDVSGRAWLAKGPVPWRDLATAEQAKARPAGHLLGSPCAELLGGGMSHRVDALFYQAVPRRRGTHRADRVGEHGARGAVDEPFLFPLPSARSRRAGGRRRSGRRRAGAAR